MNSAGRAWPTLPFSLVVVLLVVQLSCAPQLSPTPPPPTPTRPPISLQTPPSPEVELEIIDDLIGSILEGHIAYNAPGNMQLDETTTIQLLLSPSISTSELEEQITGSGRVISSALSITPRMRAELTAADLDAFSIQPLHNDPEQIVSNQEPTEWKWVVHAKKGGTQTLILTLYRLIEYNGKEFWRQKTYENRITVNVSFSQRLLQVDWKWLVGILLSALLIPALWRWVDHRQKDKSKPKKRKAT